MDITIYNNPKELAEKFCKRFVRIINDLLSTNKEVHIALSGGTTPILVFQELTKQNNSGQIKVDWDNVHFYWGDERCVPPDTIESNYYNVKINMFDSLDIPESNINRIKGEGNPESEAQKYSKLLLEKLPHVNDLPQFDLILLGMGTDGHTASIFPDQIDLLVSDKICAVATHPVSKQKRITLTGKVINNAKHVIFLVTGSNKNQIVAEIYGQLQTAENYPAYYINPDFGRIAWVVDKKASSLLF